MRSPACSRSRRSPAVSSPGAMSDIVRPLTTWIRVLGHPACAGRRALERRDAMSEFVTPIARLPTTSGGGRYVPVSPLAIASMRLMLATVIARSWRRLDRTRHAGCVPQNVRAISPAGLAGLGSWRTVGLPAFPGNRRRDHRTRMSDRRCGGSSRLVHPGGANRTRLEPRNAVGPRGSRNMQP